MSEEVVFDESGEFVAECGGLYVGCHFDIDGFHFGGVIFKQFDVCGGSAGGIHLKEVDFEVADSTGVLAVGREVFVGV